MTWGKQFDPDAMKDATPNQDPKMTPSDKEIVSAIHRWRLFELDYDKMTAMEDALRLLARRIGVKQ